MKNLIYILTLASVPLANASDEHEDAGHIARYVEEIVVTGERGEVNMLNRAMTVTGFNEAMVDQLGINNNNDLEALVPGLQMGQQGQGANSTENDHIYIRGIGSQRTGAFFSDTAVATYVDGVYTDNLYALEPGNMFDVDRIEVARGPQGTTGGKSGIAGSISYFTRRPTDTFDMRALTEFTDQFTQRYNLAFGGPIGDSGFSYRLTLGYWEGDGAQENVGTGGDYDAPDQTTITPQLRFRSGPWDINLRYSRTEDKGSPRTAVELGFRDTETECLNPAVAPSGESVCLGYNPFFGAENQSPATRDCIFDPNQTICAGDDLRNAVDYNTAGRMDNFIESWHVDLNYALTDTLHLNYHYGNREHQEDSISDTDGTSRIGGGINPATGAADPFYALDGFQGGAFRDDSASAIRQSEQRSHEITLTSDYDGAFNFVLGAFHAEGDEPYAWTSFQRANRNFMTDSPCTPQLLATRLFFAHQLDANADGVVTDDEIAASRGEASVTCPGVLSDHSNTTTWQGPTSANLNGHTITFFGHASWESRALYLNTEYLFSNKVKVFGGLRYDDDKKIHHQNDAMGALDFFGFAFNVWHFRNKDIPIAVTVDGTEVCDGCGYDVKKGAKWHNLTGNIGIQYFPREDLMIYGRIASGYRAGGFAGFFPAHTAAKEGRFDDLTFDAEDLVNYEFGVKGLYFDNKLQLSSSVFYNDFKKYWMHGSELIPPEQRVPGESPFRGDISVVPDTWIAGIEIEGAWRINDQFTLRGFYNYLDSSIGNFETIYRADPQLPPTTVEFSDLVGNTWTETISLINLEGNQLPNQPSHKGSLTLLYEPIVPTEWGNVTLLTTVTHTGDKHADYANVERYKTPDYTRWDARAIWDSPNGEWSVTLFAKNLLDQISVQSWNPLRSAGGNAPSGTLTDAREIGISVLWQAF